MGVRLYNAAAEAGCNAVVDLADAGAGAGVLEVRSGAQPAINGALSGTLLASITLGDPAFGSASASGSGAVASLLGVPLSDNSANATGTAGYCAIRDSDGNVVLTGTCGTSGTDFIIDNTSIEAGRQVRITACTFRQPQGV